MLDQLPMTKTMDASERKETGVVMGNDEGGVKSPRGQFPTGPTHEEVGGGEYQAAHHPISRLMNVSNGSGENSPAEVSVSHRGLDLGHSIHDLDYDELKAKMQWRWHYIDGVVMPILLRENNAQLVSISIVQSRLLAKFPQNIPIDVAEEHVMISQKMTPIEAMTLNAVNAATVSYELGCQIFTSEDELVDVAPVEAFYWIVKRIHLSNLAAAYKKALVEDNAGQVILACIHQLLSAIESEIERASLELAKLKEAEDKRKK